jgi:hypothetical protein
MNDFKCLFSKILLQFEYSFCKIVFSLNIILVVNRAPSVRVYVVSDTKLFGESICSSTIPALLSIANGSPQFSLCRKYKGPNNFRTNFHVILNNKYIYIYFFFANVVLAMIW